MVVFIESLHKWELRSLHRRERERDRERRISMSERRKGAIRSVYWLSLLWQIGRYQKKN